MPEQDYIRALQHGPEEPEHTSGGDAEQEFRERVMAAARDLLPSGARVKLETQFPEETASGKKRGPHDTPNEDDQATPAPAVRHPRRESGKHRRPDTDSTPADDESDMSDELEFWKHHKPHRSLGSRALRAGVPILAASIVLGAGYILGTRGGEDGDKERDGAKPSLSAAEQEKLRAFHPQALDCGKPIARLALSSTATLDFTYKSTDGKSHVLVYQEAPANGSASSANSDPSQNPATTPVSETKKPSIKTTYGVDVAVCANDKTLEKAVTIDSKTGTATVDLSKLPPSISIKDLREETTPALSIFPNLKIVNSTGFDPKSVTAMNSQIDDFGGDLSVTRSQTFNGLRTTALDAVDKGKSKDAACHTAVDAGAKAAVVDALAAQLKAAGAPNAKVTAKGSAPPIQPAYTGSAHIPDNLNHLPKESSLSLEGTDVQCTVAK